MLNLLWFLSRQPTKSTPLNETWRENEKTLEYDTYNREKVKQKTTAANSKCTKR